MDEKNDSTAASSKPEPRRGKIPARWKNPSPASWVLGLVFLAFFISGLQSAGITWDRLGRGVANIGLFLSRAIPPDTSRTVPLLERIKETFDMVFVGVTFGVLLSLPFALLASSRTNKNPVIQILARATVSTMRTIPDLIWAMIFLIAVGLGPLAGILTIVVDTIGFCARFFSERIDEVDNGPPQALQSTGASKGSVIFGAILPISFPSMVGTSLYAIEKAIRSAVVLGLVGAGGIGVELSTSMRLRRFDEASMIILLVLAVVLTVEQISTRIRRRYI